MAAAPAATKPVVRYFAIRGKGEPIRVALTDLGVDFENHVVDFAAWPKIKAEGIADGSLPFTQLPAYADEDGKFGQMNGEVDFPSPRSQERQPQLASLSRSVSAAALSATAPPPTFPASPDRDNARAPLLAAILRHIGRKHGACGATEAEMTQVDMFLEAVEDVRQAYLKLVYTEGCEEGKCAEFAATHTDASARNGGKIAHLNNAAARLGGKFIAGTTEATVADYSAFCLFDDLLRVCPAVLESQPWLAAWLETMRARPRIAAYVTAGHEYRTRVNGNGKG